MRLRTYLINLDGSDARLASATQQLEAQDIAFERVPAFDGRGRAVETLPGYDAAAAMAYMGRPLKGGEIGCYLSHLDCARRFLDTDADYAVVLEDDIQLYPDSAARLSEMLDWIKDQPADWDVINLGANRYKYCTPIKQFGTYSLSRGHYFPMTTTALVWNRAGAEAFLRDHAAIRMPVDNALREWQSTVDRGLAVVPGLIITTGSDSDIDSQASQRQNGQRSAFYGFKKLRRMWRNKARAWAHQRAFARRNSPR